MPDIFKGNWIYRIQFKHVLVGLGLGQNSFIINRYKITGIYNSFFDCMKIYTTWQLGLARWETPTKVMSSRLCRSHGNGETWLPTPKWHLISDFHKNYRVSIWCSLNKLMTRLHSGKSLSMLGLKLDHISKRGPGVLFSVYVNVIHRATHPLKPSTSKQCAPDILRSLFC